MFVNRSRSDVAVGFGRTVFDCSIYVAHFVGRRSVNGFESARLALRLHFELMNGIVRNDDHVVANPHLSGHFQITLAAQRVGEQATRHFKSGYKAAFI